MGDSGLPDGVDYYALGLDLMRECLGDEAAEASLARRKRGEETGDDTADFPVKVGWGFLMHRPQLSMRDRALVMLVSDVVQLRPAALRDHTRVALYMGMTREEINEVIFHLAFYCGFPTTREAGLIVRSVYAEIDAAQKGDS